MNDQQKNILLVALLMLSSTLVVKQFLTTGKSDGVHPSLIPVNVSSDPKKTVMKTPYEDNQVKNTIAKYNGEIQKCYLKHLENPKAETSGRVQVDWQISPSGETLSPSLVSSNMNDQEFADCIVNKVKTFKFPPPPTDKPLYTSFGYVFHKQGESLAPQLVTTPNTKASKNTKK
mgnify:CR=1 FL=1